MDKRGGGVILRAAMIVMAAEFGWLTMTTSAKPTLHKVGGSHGWNQNINYTLWASTRHFSLGDWLYFHFDKRYYNVLQVNQTSYESCNDRDFIKNVTRGGRDVFELTEARTYYFLSGGGYCYHGMRVAVSVIDHGHDLPPTSTPIVPVLAPAPAPALTSTQNASPFVAITSFHMFVYVVLCLTSLWDVLF